jgi:hypothetical protein
MEEGFELEGVPTATADVLHRHWFPCLGPFAGRNPNFTFRGSGKASSCAATSRMTAPDWGQGVSVRGWLIRLRSECRIGAMVEWRRIP